MVAWVGRYGIAGWARKALLASACAGARRSMIATLAGACLASALATNDAAAIEKAEAAKGPPVTVAVFVGSRNDVCYDPGDVDAIKRLVAREEARINQSGGVGGRPLNVKVLDDARDDAKAVANVRAALGDPTLLAMVGITNSTRATAVFKELGKSIHDSGVPFLSDISVSTIFADHPNVFTTRASQDEVRGPVMAEFSRTIGFQRFAFLGLKDAVFSAALGDSLKKALGEAALLADHRLPAKDGVIEAPAIAPAVADIIGKNVDMLFLGAGGKAAPELIKALGATSAPPALFIVGRIDALPIEITSAYPNAIYQLAWEGLPEIYNNRLRKMIAQDDPEQWVFEGRKIAAAPGWSKGECKPRPEVAQPDPLEPANLRAIQTGAQYADMLALIAAAGRNAQRGLDLQRLRSRILTAIKTEYAAGRGAFKGTFENWAFDPATRTATRMPFVVILPQGLGRTQLAPIQYSRSRDGKLRQMTTLYADIDLIKADRVDDNANSFFAEFYLSMRANDVARLDRLEFSNAFIDPASGNRQITIETIHGGGPSAAYPESMKIYKVAGRFLFNPDLQSYPLDSQLFSIDLQPKSGDMPFIVQPPPLSLRDKLVITDGWDQITQYVGAEEDFVPVVDAYTHEPSIVPFYKASFAWMMKRQTTDYILRVVVPLAFILIVAYLSIFIPKANFEAIVTIQVTALLSAVALYLSLPQLASDTATLSDRMFVFDYMMVSAMIVISILRVNPLIASRGWLVWTLDVLHVVVIPILVAIAGLYVYGLSVAER